MIRSKVWHGTPCRDSLLLIYLCVALFCCQLVSTTATAAELPANDSGKHQLIVVGEVGQWFADNPDLARLRAATAFMAFKPDSPLFKARYESVLGSDVPIVAYLRPDGGVVYFADKHIMPTRENLFAQIKDAHFKAKNALPTNPALNLDLASCPDGNCPLDPPDSQPTRPRFPNLRPFHNPLDDETQPTMDRIFSGWFVNTIGSGMWLIFSVIALGFVLFFFILLIGAMLIVAKLWK